MGRADHKTRSSRLVAGCPVFYGWVILAVGALGGVMTSPGQTYAFSAFLDHLIEDLELSRSLVSTLYTAATLTASLVLPFVGRQFDRRGARVTIAVASLLLGLACIYMSFVRNAAMLVVGFFLLRQLGQGSLSLVSKSVINLWWVRRRGVALGVSGVVGAMLGGLFPFLINTLIPLHGWRFTYVILGAVVMGVMAPFGWIFTRDRPEDYGVEPDGQAAFPVAPSAAASHGVAQETGARETVARETGARETAVPAPSGPGPGGSVAEEPLEVNWALAEAVRAPAFWVVTAGLASMSMLNTGLTFHLFSIFADSGLSSTVTASVFVPIAVTGAAMQLVGGLLVGRVPVRALLALSLVLEALLLVLAPVLTSVAMAYGFGVCMGLQGGLEMLVAGVIYANYFGRRNLGSIAGLASTLLVAASALGPMPIGVARDLLGQYDAVLHAFALLPLALAGACLFFGRPPGRPGVFQRGESTP